MIQVSDAIKKCCWWRFACSGEHYPRDCPGPTPRLQEGLETLELVCSKDTLYWSMLARRLNETMGPNMCGFEVARLPEVDGCICYAGNTFFVQVQCCAYLSRVGRFYTPATLTPGARRWRALTCPEGS